MSENPKTSDKTAAGDQPNCDPNGAVVEGSPRPKEIGGPKGPEPTRYGDWEVGGRCSDF